MRIPVWCVVLLVLLPVLASAAEWPRNWLGPKDNQFISLKIGVYYFAAVLHDFPDGEGNPSLPGPADEWLHTLAERPELKLAAMETEFERVSGELDAAAAFMWRNSRFNFAVDYVYFPDYTPRLRSSMTGSDAPYFSPVDFELYGDARATFDGLLQIMVLYRFNDETGELERIRGGGGFTWGCDAETGKCGWSWWAACTEDNVCGSDWLMVHEFGHQIDSLFEQSGHPEFWFNHLAPSEGNTARFGEHFDANSYIMRRVPEADWLELNWGTVRTATDSDGDGVPASDDWLAARGYLTDHDDTLADTDSDGMSDYAEFMAANGNRNGHGERLHPLVGYCDPLNPDSDGDGRPDGDDPLPSIAGEPFIRTIEGDVDDPGGDLTFPSSLERYDLSLAYESASGEDEEADAPDLLILLHDTFLDEETVDLEYKLMLDLDNNGWFYGSDNYQLIFTATELSSFTQHIASSHAEWPHVVQAGGDTDHVLDPSSGGGVLIWLPQALIPEFGGKPGEMIGLNIGVSHAGEPWYYMLGEPNTLIQFELR